MSDEFGFDFKQTTRLILNMMVEVFKSKPFKSLSSNSFE